MYGPFESERIVGRAIEGRRTGTFLATKVGLVAEELGSMRRGGSPEHLRAACDASLQRLGVDRIDLYYLHRVDEIVPVEESWGAVDLDPGPAGRRAALVRRERRGVRRVLPARPRLPGRGARLREADPGGRLPGPAARFTAEALAANAAIVDGVLEVAARRGVTPAQVALGWVLARGEQVHVIPGTTRAAHLQAHLAAGDVDLTADDLAALDSLPAPVGARY